MGITAPGEELKHFLLGAGALVLNILDYVLAPQVDPAAPTRSAETERSRDRPNAGSSAGCCLSNPHNHTKLFSSYEKAGGSLIPNLKDGYTRDSAKSQALHHPGPCA